MPRKQRTPKARRDVPLTPSMRHFLLCGCTAYHYAPARLPGWTETHLEIVPDAEALTAMWLAHRSELIAEAKSAGFEPVAQRWFAGDRLRADASDVPTDTSGARDQWSERFCHEHGY
jgi:hypothetical protein